MSEQPSDAMKLTWKQGRPAPDDMEAIDGAAVVRESSAYFSLNQDVYSYTLPKNKWTKLPGCKHKYFALAVVHHTLTAIGGKNVVNGMETNTLLSYSGRLWKMIFPSMHARRRNPATCSTPTHLVVAGGRQTPRISLRTVEILNINTLQWSTATSFPGETRYPQMARCNDRFYFADDKSNIFFCSVEDLIIDKSTNSSDGASVWTRLASIPREDSSLASLNGHVVAIGGLDGDHNQTGTIHYYDVATNSWTVISEMPTRRSLVLTAVLPNKLVVVGGFLPQGSWCSITEIGSY